VSFSFAAAAALLFSGLAGFRVCWRLSDASAAGGERCFNKPFAASSQPQSKASSVKKKKAIQAKTE